MGLTIELPEELELKLSKLASKRGLSLPQYVLDILASKTPPERSSGFLSYGKYRGPDPSTEEDFRTAEWHLNDGDFDGQ